MLDLDQVAPSWRVLPTWPGPERFYAIAGSDEKSFFLLSGIRRTQDANGKPALEYLRDAYRFDPVAETWERLPDLPHPNAAVASPAPYVDGGLLLLGRGAEGTGTNLPLDRRQAFGRETLRFDIATRRFNTIGSLPFGTAAVASANWHGSIIIASGEIAPGVRSPTVWSIRPESLAGRAQSRSD
jgi:N-acetylneuraminic acid mutarotase